MQRRRLNLKETITTGDVSTPSPLYVGPLMMVRRSLGLVAPPEDVEVVRKKRRRKKRNKGKGG